MSPPTPAHSRETLGRKELGRASATLTAGLRGIEFAFQPFTQLRACSVQLLHFPSEAASSSGWGGTGAAEASESAPHSTSGPTFDPDPDADPDSDSDSDAAPFKCISAGSRKISYACIYVRI